MKKFTLIILVMLVVLLMSHESKVQENMLPPDVFHPYPHSDPPVIGPGALKKEMERAKKMEEDQNKAVKEKAASSQNAAKESEATGSQNNLLTISNELESIKRGYANFTDMFNKNNYSAEISSINNKIKAIQSSGPTYSIKPTDEELLNNTIKKLISEVYQGDVESLRNLQKVASSLTNGGIEIPGDFKISGNLNVAGTFNMMPSGSIIAFDGHKKIPDGWVLCDGKTVTYNKLKIKVPDLRNKFIFGYDGTSPYDSSKSYGSEKIRLTSEQLPRHGHGASSNVAGDHWHQTIRNNDFSRDKPGTGFNYYGGCFSGRGNGFGAGGGDANFGYQTRDNKTNCFATGNSGNHSHDISIDETGNNEDVPIMPPHVILSYIYKL